MEAVPWSTSRLALVARGTSPGEFKGDFSDELFGVFIVDSTLSTVMKTLETFPTRRWHDYAVDLRRAGPDSLYLVGQGSSYGDEAIRRTYDWRSLSPGK